MMCCAPEEDEKKDIVEEMKGKGKGKQVDTCAEASALTHQP